MIGFRIFPLRRRIASEIVERYRAVPVANVSDSMSRMFAAGSHLRQMHKAGVLAGPAFTVKTRPGDNLMLHKALDMAEPGDVIVVDGGGDLTNSLVGELMISHAITRGIAGMVLDAAVRDYGWIQNQTFPVFAAGVTHRGPYKDGPGEINVPIAIDGMLIAPGDLMLGDPDGVLSVPFDDVETVYAGAKAKSEAEARQLEVTLAKQLDRSWVDAELERRGCEVHS